MKGYKVYYIQGLRLSEDGRYIEKRFESLKELKDFLKKHPYRIDWLDIRENYGFKDGKGDPSYQLIEIEKNEKGEYSHNYIIDILNKIKE